MHYSLRLVSVKRRRIVLSGNVVFCHNMLVKKDMKLDAFKKTDIFWSAHGNRNTSGLLQRN